MVCPDKYISYMHEYLDGGISVEQERQLKEHLQQCPKCQSHFHELEKTVALLQSTGSLKTSDNFTAKVMESLPKEKRKAGIQRWFRRHPLLTAATLFLVLMMGSMVSSWNQGDEFTVSKQANLVVENNTVIVPEGEVVEGDIVVRNGDIRIEGKVNGNVTVVNGEKYLASVGEVTGEIEEINAVFDWIWYQMKNFFAAIGELFTGAEETKEQSQEVAVFQ